VWIVTDLRFAGRIFSWTPIVPVKILKIM